MPPTAAPGPRPTRKHCKNCESCPRGGEWGGSICLKYQHPQLSSSKLCLDNHHHHEFTGWVISPGSKCQRWILILWFVTIISVYADGSVANRTLNPFPVKLQFYGEHTQTIGWVLFITSTSEKLNFAKVYNYINIKNYYSSTLGCPRKTLFQKNRKRNPPRISLGVSLNRSKRIFDLDQV